MNEHPESVNVPSSHLVSLFELCEYLQVSPEDYLTWVIRGAAPPLNVLLDGESHILREDISFWMDSLKDLKPDEEPEDVLALKLTLDEVSAIFEVPVDEYLEWVQEGDAPALSTFDDGTVGVVRAVLDVWMSDLPTPEDIVAGLREAGVDILKAFDEEFIDDADDGSDEIF